MEQDGSDSAGDNTCRIPAPIYLQIYQVLAILVGVVGNGFVIYASKQYSTFNLDSNTIFLVRHLGYADVAILLLGFLPANFMFLGQLDEKQGAFKVICTIQGICMNVFGLAVLSITAGISVHRLLRCTLPQSVARVRRKIMLSLVAVCYGAATAVALLVMVIPPAQLTYRYDNGYYSCIGHFEQSPDEGEQVDGNSDNNKGGTGYEETAAQIARGIGMSLSALFFLIIILINVLLHHFSKKKLANLQGNSLKKHKTSRYRTLTTHSISALLVLTWLPFATTFFVTISGQSHGRGASAECQSNPVVRHVSTFVINFYLLNFVLNPFLYCVTNINFMKFVIKLMKRNCNHYLCVALWTKINPDLDISTNVSTLDQCAGSSTNCPVTPERVYSNMLTVPDTSSTKRKGAHLKSSDPDNYDSPFLMEAGKKHKRVTITLTDERRSESEIREGADSEIIQIGSVKSTKNSRKVTKSKQKVFSKCTLKSKASKADEKSETVKLKSLKRLFSKKQQKPQDSETERTVPEEVIKPVDVNIVEIAVS